MVKEVQVSNLIIQTSQMKKVEVDHQIGNFWQPRKRTKAWQPECWPKSSIWTIQPPFADSKSSEKYGNWLNGSLYELSDNNNAERVWIFPDLLQRNELTPFLKKLVTLDRGFSSNTWRKANLLSFNWKVFILPRVAELLIHKEKQRDCPPVDANKHTHINMKYI